MESNLDHDGHYRGSMTANKPISFRRAVARHCKALQGIAMFARFRTVCFFFKPYPKSHQIEPPEVGIGGGNEG